MVIVRPNIEIKTADSRKVVKKKVKIEKMTQQSANLGSFVSSLYSEDFDLMSRSVIDQVVEPDRAVLIPEFEKIKMISKTEWLYCSRNIRFRPINFFFIKQSCHFQQYIRKNF